MHIYYFKNRQCWDVPIPKACSWVLKKIMKCRPVIDAIGGWRMVEHCGKMKIQKLYNLLRLQQPKVEWRRLVCHNPASPKSVFILWLALRNKLMTKERLFQWSFVADDVCPLCQAHPENC